MPNRLVRSRIFRVLAGIKPRHIDTRALKATGAFGIVAMTMLGLVTMMWPLDMAVAAPGINKTINFQGKVTNQNGTNVADGSYTFVFRMYTQQAPGGTAVWTETKSISTTDGVFQTNLGSVTALPGSVNFNTDNIFLSMAFNGDPEMSPRIQLTASPYAFNSDMLDGLDSSDLAQLDPASAQSGSLNVTGTVAAGTSLQSPLVDNAGTLGIGTGAGTTAVTVGRAVSTAAVTIQGSAGSSWTVTGASGSTTVNFAAPTAANTITFPNAGGTICTTVASTCSATYQAASATGYLAKNAADTSSANVAGALLGFTNTNTTSSARVLDLTNAGTGSTLNVLATANPGSSAALIKANNLNASPSGNLLDLQISGISQFAVASNGNLTQVSGATINGQTISSAANFTGTVRVATGFGVNSATPPTHPVEVNAVTTTNTATTNAQVLIGTNGAGNYGLVVQGAASRTVPLAEFQDSNGNAILQIGSSGSTNTYSFGRFQTQGGLDLDVLASNAGTITKRLMAGTGGVSANDVVILTDDGGSARAMRTTTARDTRVYGVATTAVTSGSAAIIAIAGNYQVTATTGAVAIGDQLVTSSTAGQVMVDNNATTGIVGIATTAKVAGSSGLVGLMIRPVGGVVNPNLQGGNLTTTGTVSAGSVQTTLIDTPSAGGTLAVGTTNATGGINLNQNTTLAAGKVLAMSSAAATDQVLSVRVTGDTNDRFIMTADGTMKWGAGNATTDTNLYRAGADLLRTDDSMVVGSSLYVGTTTPSALTKLYVQPNAGTTVGLAVRGASGGQSVNMMELQNASGEVLSRFDSNGQLVLGRSAGTGALQAGSAAFVDGSNTNGYAAMLTVGALTGNRTISLPDAGGTLCTTVASTCSATYQVASATGYLAKNTTDSSSFGVSANDVLYSFTNSGTSTGSRVLDLTNAGTGSALTVNASANPQSGAALIKVNNTNASPSGNLVDLQTNGTSRFAVSATGDTTVAGSVSAAFALTSTGSTGSIQLSTTSATNGVMTKGATAATALNQYEVVVLNASAQAARTTTARDPKVYGVVAFTNVSAGAAVNIGVSGNYQVTATTGAVAIGDQLVTSSTSGQVMVDNNATTGIVGIATTAKVAGSSGLVGVMLRPMGGAVNPDLQGGNLTTTGTLTGGTVRATVGLQASSLDTASATGLGIGGTNATSVTVTPSMFTASDLTIGSTSTLSGTTGRLTVMSGAINQPSIVARQFTGQTANLLEVQNSSGTAMALITVFGSFRGAGSQHALGTITAFNASTTVSVSANTVNNVAVAVRQVAGGNGDLLQLQDSSGNVHGAFNSAGNQLTLGRSAGTGTNTTGAVALLDGGNTNGYAATLTVGSNTLTGNRSISLPNESGTVCLQSSGNCGFVTGSAGSFIQNQIASAQSANFYIQSGSATASDPTAIIRLATGQTGKLMQFQAANGTEIGYVQNDGSVSFKQGFFTSPSNGVAALRVKGSNTDIIQAMDVSNNVMFNVDVYGYLHVNRAAAAADNVFTSRVTSDTNDRFTIGADGTLKWGPGNGASDITIQRTGSTTLQMTGQLGVYSGMQVGNAGFLGKLTVQPGGSGTIGQVIKGFTGQAVDLLQIRDENDNTNAAFNSTGNRLTLGRSAGTGTNSTGAVAVMDGGNANGYAATLTVGSNTLTGNRSINLPNESGTVCLQSSGNCGFVTGSNDSFIQNQSTTAQAANFYIQSAGAAGVSTGVIKVASGQTGDLLQFQDATTTAALARITNTGSYKFGANTTLAGAVAIDLNAFNIPATNGITIQAASGQAGWLIELLNNTGTRIGGLDGSGNFVAASRVSTVDRSTASTHSSDLTVRSGNATGSTSNSGNLVLETGTATGTVGAVNIAQTTASAVNIGRNGITTGVTGVLSVSSSTSNSALAVTQSSNPVANQALIYANNSNASPSGNLIDLRSGGTSRFSVATTGNTIVGGNAMIAGTATVGTTGTTTGALLFKGATAASGTITVQAPSNPNTYTINLPNSTGGPYTMCTTDATSCNSVYQAAGNYLAKDAADTSTASTSGAVLALRNTNTSSGRVLDLTNDGTGSTLNILSTSNPGAGASLLKVNNQAASPSGLLMDLQQGGTSRFSVAQSGAVAQTSNVQGTDANSITANSLTTGAAFKVTSASNTAANSSWSAISFNPTNAQATTAVTGSNLIAGLDVQFTQNPTVAGNNETVANLAVKRIDTSVTDATVGSILNLTNSDTAVGNQVTVTDALKIGTAGGTGSITNGITIAGGTSAVTNGINLTGTFGTSLITATNFSVSQAGAIVGVGVNAGSGLLQGSGGLTTTGTASINNDANFATSINTGTSTGTITLGGGSAPLVINSTAFDVTSAGVISGATGLSSSGTITFSGLTTQGPVYTTSGGTLSSETYLSVTRGGTGIGTATAYGLIAGGTTATGAYQSVGTGTSGQILRSNGAAALPSWVDATAANFCSDCALTSLNNLSSVAINTSLLSGSATIDLGSGANPFRDLYLGGTATNNFRMTGTATGARTITLDDLTGRMALVQSAGSSTAQTGDLNVSGMLIAGTKVQSALLGTADVASGTSAATTLRSGDGTAGNAGTGTLTIRTGNANGSGTSGNIFMDTGSKSASGFTGSVNIGTVNASSVTVGRNAGTGSTMGLLLKGTASASSIVMSDGTNANQTTLTFTVPTTARSIVVPDAAGTVCLSSGNCSGTNGYILNQIASAQTGNFWIAQTGRANQFQADTMDAQTASGTLSIGPTNASAITLQQNTTVASGRSFTVQGAMTQSSGAFSLTGNAASSVTTSAGALTITSAAAANWSTAAGDLSVYAAGNLNLGGSGGGTINVGSVGTATAATTVHIADTTNSTNAQMVTIGSTANAGSATTVQGGSAATGGVVLQATTVGLSATNLQFTAGGARNIRVASATSGSGNSLTIAAGNGATASDNGGDLVLQAGAAGGAGTGRSGSVIVRSNGTNQTAAFDVQNASNTSQFRVDTANSQVVTQGMTLTTNTITPSGAMTIGATTQNTTLQGGQGTKMTATNAAGTATVTIDFATITNTGTYRFANPSAAGPYTICTSDLTSCGSSGVGYLRKGVANESSNANLSTNGQYLYNFSNSGSMITDLLQLDNGTGTGSTLRVVAAANPTANNALIYARLTNASVGGNLVDLWSGASGAETSKFSVSAAGAVTTASTINGQTISSVANFTGTVGTAGLLTANSLSVTNGATFNAGATINNAALTVNAGASVTGGINNNAGGITAAGAVSGLTSLQFNTAGTIDANAGVSIGLGTTNASALNIGRSTGTPPTVSIQGNLSTALTGSDGTNTISVGFAGAPSGGNIVYQFSNTATAGATYQICTTFANTCGTTYAAYYANGYVQLAPGTAQNDASANPSIFINKTTTAYLMRLQSSGTDVFSVQSNGTMTSSGTSYLGGTSASYVAQVDTTNFKVRIGTGSPTLGSGGSSATAGLYVSGASEFAGTIRVGDNTNNATFDGTTKEVTYNGTARHARRAQLVPEYPGATMSASATSGTTGLMTSDFCAASNLTNLTIPTTVAFCPTAGDTHNYYKWTSVNASTQTYDIYVNYTMPSDFAAFASDAAINMYGYRTGASDNVQLALFRANGTQCGSTTSVSTSNAAWTENALSGTITGCSIAANERVTFRVRLTSTSTANSALAGEIRIDYLSKW